MECLRWPSRWSGRQNVPAHERRPHLAIVGRDPAERVGVRRAGRLDPLIALLDPASGENVARELIEAIVRRGERLPPGDLIVDNLFQAIQLVVVSICNIHSGSSFPGLGLTSESSVTGTAHDPQTTVTTSPSGYSKAIGSR